MKKKKKTLLWKISTPILHTDSYLFGTMHVRDIDAFRYKQIVFEKIDACDAFATEFNLEEMQHNVSADVLDLPQGQTLDFILTEKQYEKVRNTLLKITGMDIVHFNTSQPILLANLLAGSMLSQQMPYSLDETLWHYARQQGKVVLGIETYAEQINIMRQIPLDYQVKNLMAIVKNIKAYRREIKKLTRLYKEAQIQKLYKSVKKSSKGLRKLLLYNRNIIMAERITQLATEQSVCVAIGAGHLAGAKGVIRLLKKKGFRLNPIKAPDVI